MEDWGLRNRDSRGFPILRFGMCLFTINLRAARRVFYLVPAPSSRRGFWVLHDTALICASYPGAQRMAYVSHIGRNAGPTFLVQYVLYWARLSDQILTPGMYFTVCMTTYFSSNTKSLWRLAQIIAEEVLFELKTF